MENLRQRSDAEGNEGMLTISKEKLAVLPTARFEGEIKVIDTEEGVMQAVSELRRADMIGFDTETKPNFKKGQNHTVALVQLSTRTTCYLFRINKTGLTEPLKGLLEDAGCLKIGLSLKDDFHNLAKICNIAPQGFVELQQLARQKGIAEASLSKIHAILFGKRLSKNQRLSNWEAEELSEAQQHYAALDASTCIEIYKKLTES